MPTNLEASKAMLSTPVPVPNQFGSTGMFQTKTNTYDPYAIGDATPDYASMAGSETGLSQINEADMDLTGANVGGLVTDTTSSDQWKTFIPEQADPVEDQITQFHDAAAGEGFFKMYDSKGEQITGKRAARGAKRADRRADRKARKDAGLKGAEKRQMRRAQRRQRRSAWQTYKGESDLAAEEAAADLELL